MDLIGRYGSAFFSALEFHIRRFWIEWLVVIPFLLLLVGVGYQELLAPPSNFPTGAIVTITRGESAAAISSSLAAAHIVRHPTLLRLLLRFSGAAGSIHSGAYWYPHPQNVLTIAYRLSTGDSGIAATHVTFPEGTTARFMAARVAQALPEISADAFLTAAQPHEGYLFPDTYTFLPDATEETVVTALRDNFDVRVAPLMEDIEASGHTIDEIVVMASLLEKEARGSTDKKMVAGILWNRIRVGMPLQVDAVFGYINARATYAPSFEDLGVDSPYNTYLNKGLPPGPIDNPGFDSLDAAVHPTPSKYLYYLTGRDGLMHYATTFAEHKANRAKYLD